MATIAMDLRTICCCVCGVTFAIGETFNSKLQETGNEFYCPNGHKQHYGSLLEKLRAEVDAAKREAQRQRENFFEEQRRHEATSKRLRTTKKSFENLQKRTAAGVCPCCQRTVSQLARHMQSKHADFVKEHGIPVTTAEK
jgi:hypothetical protein